MDFTWRWIGLEHVITTEDLTRGDFWFTTITLAQNHLRVSHLPLHAIFDCSYSPDLILHADSLIHARTINMNRYLWPGLTWTTGVEHDRLLLCSFHFSPLSQAACSLSQEKNVRNAVNNKQHHGGWQQQSSCVVKNSKSSKWSNACFQKPETRWFTSKDYTVIAATMRVQIYLQHTPHYWGCVSLIETKSLKWFHMPSKSNNMEQTGLPSGPFKIFFRDNPSPNSHDEAVVEAGKNKKLLISRVHHLFFQFCFPQHKFCRMFW